ncbi:MAG: hypothetical protein MK089_04285 [Phycisphaerales bacterium]|nr:hypothetical protein [Phycisphaerales bacterium]
MSDSTSGKSEVWFWIIAFALIIGARALNNLLGDWSWALSGGLVLLFLCVLTRHRYKTGKWSFWRLD